jgi:hypothetical protein
MLCYLYFFSTISLKPAIVTRTLNDSSTAALLSSIDDDAVLIIDANPVADIDERKAIAR